MLVLAAGSVALIFFSGESRNGLISRSIVETKETTVLTGHFVEHLISERVDKLYSAAYAGSQTAILEELAEYNSFVGNTYGHRGAYKIGLLDSGFKYVNGFSSGDTLCPVEALLNADIAERLLKGKIYVGPVPEICIKGSEDLNSLMLFAIPVQSKDGFRGVVFEASTLLDYIYSYNIGNSLNGFVSAEIVIDDVAKYKSDSTIYELLHLKGQLDANGAILYDGNIAGFYTFYVQDIKLTLIYIKEVLKSNLDLECCPWVEKYKLWIFLSPLMLLTLWVIMQIVSSNSRLAKEVDLRTIHIESLRKRYKKLFDTIPEYVVVYKSDGEILDCNERFVKILQGSNPVGANILYMIKEKGRFRAMISETLNERVSGYGEFLLSIKENQVSVSVNSSIVDIDGGDAILSVMTDITDLKKMHNTFYLAQKREAVGTLAAGMVHDFSNILQNVSLQYSLLERSKEEGRDQKMKSIKNILEGANEYLTGVLGYTKDTNNEYEVKKGIEFVKDAVEMLERVLPADIHITLEDFSGHIKIKAVQVKMTQMLINLCQNASDAMDNVGTIHIKTDIEEKVYGRFFSIKIKDSGVGIDECEIEKLFKPFYTTKKVKGTGLGLATVKQIIMEFGGFVEVESTKGEGTEFTLMFSEIQ
ncbi:MAG: hypothetical protein C0603_10110 [Denitrovibrio sp.]|nr:MAG: hypothetical protein C0603_10110 [Denitrovibrio sp.]